MTPAARYQAAIEILDSILDETPTEKALTGWARRSRFAGSKDRAAIRDIVFDVMRQKRSCAASGQALTGRGLVIGLLRQNGADLSEVFNGIGHAPTPLEDEETGAGDVSDTEALDLPEWLIPALTEALGDNVKTYAETLKNRAPVMLRVNTRKATREKAISVLAQDGVTAEPSEISPTALRVTDGPRRVAVGQAYADGLVELQDGASQAAVDLLPLQDDTRVLDYCAGGGGKTLAMAGHARAQFFAHDTNIGRMKDLPDRAKRAGVRVEQLDEPSSEAPFDLILCDAPCSGSGSWRRAPEGKWALTSAQLSELNETQGQILTQAAEMVGAESVLAYATCSVLGCENDDIIDGFLAVNSAFKETHRQTWLPGSDGDGFFLSLLKRV